MGFLDSYLNKYRLDEITTKAKASLDKVEKDLEKILQENEQNPAFDECVKRFGPQVADLVERFSAHFASLNGWSLETVAQSLRFVINIGTEVYQIVETVKDLVVKPKMTPAEAHTAKVEFGQNLCYFVWMTVDPLKEKLSWLPFKKTIEKKVVFWVAGMALEHTVDLFAANAGVSLMEVGKPTVFKAIP